MCEICQRTPCNPRCPNAPEPPIVYVCKYCKDSIVDGEEYIELDGEQYHTECFEDAATAILFKDYGATKGIAEIGDVYDD